LEQKIIFELMKLENFYF